VIHQQLPTLLIVLAVIAVLAGVILYRRAGRHNQPTDSTSGGGTTQVKGSPRTASAAAVYRSRVVNRHSTSTNPPAADSVDDLEAADTTDGRGSSQAMQKSVSTTSISSVSSTSSWRRNNNVDLYDESEPV
jgi:Tfp pilus assembly major pilin PilA